MRIIVFTCRQKATYLYLKALPATHVHLKHAVSYRPRACIQAPSTKISDTKTHGRAIPSKGGCLLALPPVTTITQTRAPSPRCSAPLGVCCSYEASRCILYLLIVFLSCPVTVSLNGNTGSVVPSARLPQRPARTLATGGRYNSAGDNAGVGSTSC